MTTASYKVDSCIFVFSVNLFDKVSVVFWRIYDDIEMPQGYEVRFGHFTQKLIQYDLACNALSKIETFTKWLAPMVQCCSFLVIILSFTLKIQLTLGHFFATLSKTHYLHVISLSKKKQQHWN